MGETFVPREGDQSPEPVCKPDVDRSRPHEGHRTREIGGPQGPEPTRYGDWERRGRCIDF
ncbi:MAG: DUF1674 domain-containing protein [Gammaproteobacteria bacterium]